MSKHTPGPWKIHHNRHLPKGISIEAPKADRDFVIARIPLDSDEDMANTRLIEKAPEILAALDELLTQTVDQDLKYGITLSEGEAEARAKALELFKYISGE